jgi:hypothetical protein
VPAAHPDTRPQSDPGVAVDVDDDLAEPVLNPRVSSVGLSGWHGDLQARSRAVQASSQPRNPPPITTTCPARAMAASIARVSSRVRPRSPRSARARAAARRLMRPDGLPIWISEVEPGSVHYLTAARQHALGALYAAASAGLPTLADPGYEGAGQCVLTPVKQPADGSELDINTRTRNARNALLRSLRCLGERGFALLTAR